MKAFKIYRRQFNEALPLDYAKKISAGWDKSRLDDWFNGRPRVYLPLEKKLSSDENVVSGIELAIKDIIESQGYEIKDYSTGIVYNKNQGREEKLGKVLKKLKQDKLLKDFTQDKTRASSNIKQPIVAISRHPVDIAGMSTDRGWTSCKNLGFDKIYGKTQYGKGAFSRYVKHEIYTLLIAYLIRPDDKKLRNPIARVLLLPYMNKKREIGFIVASRVYGSTGDLENVFIKTVQKWVDSKQGKLQGVYKINPFIYNDNQPTRLSFGDVTDDDGDFGSSANGNYLIKTYDIDPEYADAIAFVLAEEDISVDDINRVTTHRGVTIETSDKAWLFLTDDEADQVAIDDMLDRFDNGGIEYIYGWEDYVDEDYYYEIMIEDIENYAYEISTESDDTYENRLVEECYELNLISDDDFEKIVELDDLGMEHETDEPDYSKCILSNDDLIQKYVDEMSENNPVEWYKNNFGVEGMAEHVDVERLANHLIDIDGRGSIIARYDGIENSIDNIYYYRRD